MSLPVRRDDPKAVERARREVIAPAMAEAAADLHIKANRATIYVAEKIYTETSQVEHDMVFEAVAPHSEALIEQAANEFRGMALDGTREIREKYRGFGRS